MNEDELRLIVDRARAAEDSPATPPPGLADRARAKALRRRRMVVGGAGTAVAAGVTASVALPRVLPDNADEPSPAVNTYELAEHGGPCPAVLPMPTDDAGYGLGTFTPADRTPRFASPDTAWVCKYATRDIAPAGHNGALYEWELNHTPRRIDESQMDQVTDAMGDVKVVESWPQECTSDLGPRYLLVTSADGDLTGVAVDDYGCRDVRLTDNPFITAPGDPQEGSGTVPGVLTSDELAATLERWWDSSPADVSDAPTPDELRVTCTDGGPQVESTTVAAQPAGVVVVVNSTMTKEGGYLTYTSDGPSGGDRLDQIPDGATYAFPPGELTLGCASPPEMDETTTVTVQVTDPYGYWRTSTLADFGCPPGGAQPSWAVGDGTGPTPRDAVDHLLAQVADTISSTRTDLTAEPAPTGYSGAVTQTWVALNRGRPAFSVVVTGSEGSFTANPDVLCGRG